MKKEDIIIRLKKSTQSILRLVEDDKFNRFFIAPKGKWSVSEHIDHLLRSIQPLNKALRIPLPGLRILFGKAGNPPRDFDQIKHEYQNAIEKGAKAKGRYIPIKKGSKEVLLKNYMKQSEALVKIINLWKDKDLDQYMLPHPFLGKLIIREMLYFSIYHTEIHGKRIEELIALEATN